MLLCLDPNSQIPQPRFMTPTARRTAIGSATAIGMSFAVFLWSPGAMAAAGCTTTGLTVECVSPGEESIAIPSGATSMNVTVVGGGGGGGGSTSGPSGGPGGAGAEVNAQFVFGTGGSLTVVVGAGGAGSSGGRGGGYSSVTAGATLVAVAGGGGGGGQSQGSQGGAGGDGAADGTAAGGAGGNAGGTDENGGRGGDAGAGGSAGSQHFNPNTGAGKSWNDNPQGAGGVGDGTSSGYGGSGYGGGGGGGYPDGGVTDRRPGGGAGGSYANPDLLIGSANFNPSEGSPGDSDPGSGGQGGESGSDGSTGVTGSVSITFIITPTPSTGSSAAAARAISLGFSLPTGIECRFDSVEASLGSWIELPSASDCTITTRTTDSQPTLLGWATKTDFPIDMAQRQVDNGWGAYEPKNEAGQLTGVFIPAGGYTLLSSDTNLHPIWAS